jgi:hypothetical protein
MSAIVCVEELRGISHPPTPRLSAAEATCARWFPKHRGATVHYRAKEIPLSSSKMARLWYEDDRLVEVSDLDAKPTLIFAFHVCTDEPSGKFLIPVSAKPTNPIGDDRCPGPYKSLTCELIEVKLKPVLETCSLSGF